MYQIVYCISLPDNRVLFETPDKQKCVEELHARRKKAAGGLPGVPEAAGFLTMSKCEVQGERRILIEPVLV